MLQGLAELVTTPALLAALLVAAPVGLLFGVVPGLGGKIAIIAMMPFTFGLDPAVGCVFLISLHAVVHTGGSAPAILFAVPGTGPSTAIVQDGYALAQKGEASRALAASAVSSAVGGLIGALLLAALIPFSLLVLKAISYPEVFLLSLFSIGVAATLGGRKPMRGLIAGAFGLSLSFVGTDPMFGVLRFTLGQDFLWEGVGLVTAMLAIFAIPEMIDVATKQPKTLGQSAVATASNGWQTLRGAYDILRYRYLVLRSSLLGALVGFVPGLGGDAAAWICYAHAAQTSKHPETFGKGAIEGVIGPEAANNAKEGGALAPTLLLGLPGSSGMAILLVALAPLGISPGPALSLEGQNLMWLIVWALVLSNAVAALVLVVAAPLLGRISSIDGRILSPFVILLCLISVQMSTHDPAFLLLTAGLALVGYAMKYFKWPRAPFVIGMVMGPVTEDALLKSLSLWGADFLLRPVSLVLLVFLFLGAWRLRLFLQREVGDKI